MVRLEKWGSNVAFELDRGCAIMTSLDTCRARKSYCSRITDDATPSGLIYGYLPLNQGAETLT